MAQHRLTVKVTGHADRKGAVDLRDFAQVCDALAKCLSRIERHLTGKAGQTIYKVNDLRTGSTVVEIDVQKKPRAKDDRGAILAMFRKAIVGIHGGSISTDLVGLDIEPFQELVQPLRDGVEAITVGRVKLTRETAVAIEHLTTLGVSSVGSVTGILERVNVHDKNECSIYPPGGWRQVLCQFPDSLLEEIRKGIKRTVTVRGVLIYVPGEPFPRKANITDLKVHPRPEELPTLEDVRELGPWGTDGMSALEFVRAIRNEQEA